MFYLLIRLFTVLIVSWALNSFSSWNLMNNLLIFSLFLSVFVLLARV